MKKIDENFYGYIRVEGDTYTYNVSDNIVTLLPAQSDPQKRDDSLYRIKSHKTDTPEYLFGEDNNSMIAILRNGKFVTDPIGTNVAIRFATPIIIKACGNAEGFFNMLTEDWCKFHAITFCGGNINALYTPGIAIEQPDVSELLKYDGARTIKMRPWSAYTRTTQFQIENEKVTLTVSIGQTAETNNAENRGAYNLGKVYTFFRFSFENAQGFEKMEKYYIIARKIVAILTSQNNICFEEVYLSQRNSEQKYFKTGICKIFDSYENYSIRQWHKVIPIFSVFDYIPNLSAVLCLLVEAIAKKSQNIKWSTKVDGKNVQHRLIRRVSMDQFYAILTGEEDAFYKMCMALPEVINSVVNEEGGVEVPHDTVIDELRKVASLYGDENGELSMAMAVYMLGFNTYMGFGEKICGELGEDRDGMLKRIYEYVRKMQK